MTHGVCACVQTTASVVRRVCRAVPVHAVRIRKVCSQPKVRVLVFAVESRNISHDSTFITLSEHMHLIENMFPYIDCPYLGVYNQRMNIY